MTESALTKLLNLIKTNFFRKSESQEASAISIDTTPTDNSTNLVTSGGVKIELDKLEQTQININSRVETLEELAPASGAAGSGWTVSQVNLLRTIFDNLAYVDSSTGQAAADQLIESLLSKPVQNDDIEQQNSLLIIKSLSNTPTQSGSTLSIT